MITGSISLICYPVPRVNRRARRRLVAIMQGYRLEMSRKVVIDRLYSSKIILLFIIKITPNSALITASATSGHQYDAGGRARTLLRSCGVFAWHRGSWGGRHRDQGSKFCWGSVQQSSRYWTASSCLKSFKKNRLRTGAFATPLCRGINSRLSDI